MGIEKSNHQIVHAMQVLGTVWVGMHTVVVHSVCRTQWEMQRVEKTWKRTSPSNCHCVQAERNCRTTFCPRTTGSIQNAQYSLQRHFSRPIEALIDQFVRSRKPAILYKGELCTAPAPPPSPTKKKHPFFTWVFVDHHRNFALCYTTNATDYHGDPVP